MGTETVFILGAGASQNAGAPLMKDFLDASRKIYSRIHSTLVRNDFDMVLEGINQLQSSHSKSSLDIHNIESVFGAFEMAHLFGSPIGKLSPEMVANLSSALRTVIAHTLHSSMRFPIEKQDIQPTATSPVPRRRYHIHPPKPYRDFLSKSFPERGSAVISFNYDLAMDQALVSSKREIDYGFTNGNQKTSSFPLLKLHGSLNWGACELCGKIHSIDLEAEAGSTEDTFTFYNIEHHDFNKLRCCPEGRVTGPLIVPPTWNKGAHHNRIAAVWKSAARHLSEARSIVVIGYSLPDSDMFFRYLYSIGTIGERPLHRFLLIDPDKKVRSRFIKLLGPGAKDRFKYMEKEFTSGTMLDEIRNLVE